MGIIKYLKILLRGVSQIMLQNNMATGLLFLIGIFINSWLMGVGAIIGVLAGTLTAQLLKYDQEDISNGIYGFNGTLVGIAIFFFFTPSALTVIAIVIGSAFSTLIAYWMKKIKIPPYTAPFVLAAWILIIILGVIGAQAQSHPVLAASSIDWLTALGKGFGQVMFQNNILTGGIFLLAIALSSGVAALYALFGSLIGVLLPYLISLPLNLTNIGIFGFNAVLCGIAFSQVKKLSSFIYALLAIIVSIFLTYLFIKFNIPSLTAPFVLATWLVLVFKKT